MTNPYQFFSCIRNTGAIDDITNQTLEQLHGLLTHASHAMSIQSVGAEPQSDITIHNDAIRAQLHAILSNVPLWYRRDHAQDTFIQYVAEELADRLLLKIIGLNTQNMT